MTEQDQWATKQIWPSLKAVNQVLKCDRSMALNMAHWWYNNSVGPGHHTIMCKTCGLEIHLSPEATDFPEV